MTHRQIWLNVDWLGVFIAVVDLPIWLNSGSRTVPEL